MADREAIVQSILLSGLLMLFPFCVRVHCGWRLARGGGGGAGIIGWRPPPLDPCTKSLYFINCKMINGVILLRSN